MCLPTSVFTNTDLVHDYKQSLWSSSKGYAIGMTSNHNGLLWYSISSNLLLGSPTQRSSCNFFSMAAPSVPHFVPFNYSQVNPLPKNEPHLNTPKTDPEKN